MNVDPTIATVAGFLLVFLIGAVTWWFKTDRDRVIGDARTARQEQREDMGKLTDKVAGVERELHVIKETLPREYAAKSELRDLRDHIDGRFDRLESKLAGKVDKP